MSEQKLWGSVKARLEREYKAPIRDVLTSVLSRHVSLAEAARELGIKRTTLYRYVRVYGIERDIRVIVKIRGNKASA